MTDKSTTDTKTKASDKAIDAAAAAKKPEAVKKIAGYLPNAKISLQKDKEGKPYGADNNPKRATSKSAGTFAKYKDGMTVEAAIAAGIKPADLTWDVSKGFIKIA